MAEHLLHHEKVSSCLHHQQFFIKLSKCLFFQATIEYLGHIVLASGVQADPQKLDAMLNWPISHSIKQLRGFLSLTGYYRRFIRGYPSLVAPLTNLLRKDAFQWNSSAVTIPLKLLNNQWCKLRSLSYLIETDASNVGIRAILTQHGHPIAYFSKKLGPKLRVCSTYINELHAVMEAVYKWWQYLLGHFCIIRTYHKSIKELLQ